MFDQRSFWLTKMNHVSFGLNVKEFIRAYQLIRLIHSSYMCVMQTNRIISKKAQFLCPLFGLSETKLEVFISVCLT